MQFMMWQKSNEQSESGAPPDPEMMARMGKLMEDTAKAGVMLSTGGMHPSAKSAHIRCSGGKFTLTDGPFAETKELIAGYAIIQVKSRAEAIEWCKRFYEIQGDGEGYIQQLHEMSDFA
jgi:hypothetical protein